MNSLLTREGLHALELLPSWQLRPHLQPAVTAPWGTESAGLIVAVVASDPEKRLWANIGKAMRALGLPHGLWSEAEVLRAHQAEQALQRVMQEKPRLLVVFGQALEKSLLGLQPTIADVCSLQGLPALSVIADDPSQKRALLTVLVNLKRRLAS